MNIPTREEAFALLSEFTKNESLIKHALSVEAAMRFYAEKGEEDVHLWSVVGLLHDFDYEKYPSQEEHPFKGAEILRSKGYDEVMVRAILSHASYSNVPRESGLEKTLFAVDELCGFITAVTLVRPSKSLSDVAVKSVKKKLKDKAFAKGVNRSDITEGTALLGITIEEHIANVIAAMQGISNDLGL